jgi:hypothetical protein
MKRYSQIQKSISVLMIFILLIQLSGCASYRVIPNSDLPDYSNYKHIVHSENTKYPLESVAVSQGLLTGKVNFNQPDKRNTINVYSSSDSVIKIDTENILSLPLDGIAKVKVPKILVPKEYIPNSQTHKNKSKEKKPVGTILWGLLIMGTGASLYYGITQYIEKNRNH